MTCAFYIQQPENIIRIEARGNYCKIYLTTGYPVTVAKVLQWFQVNLPAQMFSRVHRSHLVNSDFIEQIAMDKQSSVLLRNGERIMISRRKKALLITG